VLGVDPDAIVKVALDSDGLAHLLLPTMGDETLMYLLDLDPLEVGDDPNAPERIGG
jgi:hypothetical protein